MTMPYRPLGRTDTQVSALCLGSMTWGTQNTPEEAFVQIDLALEHGVNFIDTAEMYPTTPLSAETQGDTESIIGQWFQRSGKRAEVVLATKVTGAGPAWIQDGKPIDTAKITSSIEASLQRLQTDYIDLYQLHWPNRGSYHFRQSWGYDPTQQPLGETHEHIVDVLGTLGCLIDQGKIRHVGLSNESCWGTAQFLKVAEQLGLPRVVSIQNEYSLLHRLFDLDLAELAHHENVGLLAYSPLAAGLLSGKYADGEIPAGSRRSMNDDLSGRYSAFSRPALDRYLALAREHDVHPARLALAFCMERPFMSSVIIGATTQAQLETNLSAMELTLSESMRDGIAAIYRDCPVPM